MHASFPTLFVSHGAPTTALEKDSAFARDLRAYVASLPARPKAIVVVSAHWQTRGTAVTGAKELETIHDFGGFPRELFEIEYHGRGAPELARRIAELTSGQLDPRRGLDHGAWTPLVLAFPEADIPVVQVSLPFGGDAFALGTRLAPLRDEGVLLIGSGAATHNLGAISAGPPPAWAREFDAWIGERVAAFDLESLRAWRKKAPHATFAHPTTEHFDPMLVVLGAARPGERPRLVHEGFQYGSLSMRTFAIEPTLKA
jgi:4,5-DOPA dioxygenase extradiol